MRGEESRSSAVSFFLSVKSLLSDKQKGGGRREKYHFLSPSFFLFLKDERIIWDGGGERGDERPGESIVLPPLLCSLAHICIFCNPRREKEDLQVVQGPQGRKKSDPIRRRRCVSSITTFQMEARSASKRRRRPDRSFSSSAAAASSIPTTVPCSLGDGERDQL